MSEYVTIGVIIRLSYNLVLFKCSLKVSKLLQFIVSIERLFHNQIDVGKKLYLYASIAVSGCIYLRSLPLVCLVLCVI